MSRRATNFRELRAASRGGIQERRSIGGRPRIAESGPRGLPPVRYRLVGGAAMSDDTDLRDVLRAMIARRGLAAVLRALGASWMTRSRDASSRRRPWSRRGGRGITPPTNRLAGSCHEWRHGTAGYPSRSHRAVRLGRRVAGSGAPNLVHKGRWGSAYLWPC
jgi:hypothetical protein